MWGSMDLSQLQKRLYPLAEPQAEQASAVLVPLRCCAGEWQLLFEVRSLQLRGQPGEVCFPGGRAEPGEAPEQTVLRETEEELGIAPAEIKLLGRLPQVSTLGRRTVCPVVGVVSESAQLTPEPAEVAEWFAVPLAWFSTPPEVCHFAMSVECPPELPEEIAVFLRRYQFPRSSLLWRWDGKAIWGMTARVVQALMERLPE